MPDFTHIFDIDRIGVQLGAKTAETVMPNGQCAVLPVWTPDLAKKMQTYIRETLAGKTDLQLCQCGSAPMWVMGAALEAMYPAAVTFAPPFPGVYLKLHNLSQGDLNPAAEVEFEVRRKGDLLYIFYKADDPSKPQLYGGGHHSYNPELIPLIRTPRADGLHVCLSGNSSYNVTMSIASAYFSGCRSLSVKSAADPCYYCCSSRDPERDIGDATPAE